MARRLSRTSPVNTASGGHRHRPARRVHGPDRQPEAAPKPARRGPAGLPEQYYGIADNIEMAFGQGETLVTPLQEAVAYGTFATGGTRYAPQVVNSIVSPTGKVVKRFKPRVMGHVALPSGTYGQILGAASRCHLCAERHGLQHLPGLQRDASRRQDRYGDRDGRTPMCSRRPGSSPSGRRRATPRYVVAVVIDQAGYGAAAAAPVAREIFTYLTDHQVGPADLHPPSNVP